MDLNEYNFDSTIIRSKAQYEHCPLCGEPVEVTQFSVGKYKTKAKVECPEHGSLIHK